MKKTENLVITRIAKILSVTKKDLVKKMISQNLKNGIH